MGRVLSAALAAVLLVGGCRGKDVPYSVGQICRAVISTYSGRDVSIIKVDQEIDQIADVSYKLDDGMVWRNRCHVEWPNVRVALWREDGTLGRWRDTPDDSQITLDWGPDGIKVKEVYPDGSFNSRVVQVQRRDG